MRMCGDGGVLERIQPSARSRRRHSRSVRPSDPNRIQCPFFWPIPVGVPLPPYQPGPLPTQTLSHPHFPPRVNCDQNTDHSVSSRPAASSESTHSVLHDTELGVPTPSPPESQPPAKSARSSFRTSFGTYPTVVAPEVCSHRRPLRGLASHSSALPRGNHELGCASHHPRGVVHREQPSAAPGAIELAAANAGGKA